MKISTSGHDTLPELPQKPSCTIDGTSVVTGREMNILV